jgi:hypothetical protein
VTEDRRAYPDGGEATGDGAGGFVDDQPTDVYAALADLSYYKDPAGAADPAPDPRYAFQPDPAPEPPARPDYSGYEPPARPDYSQFEPTLRPGYEPEHGFPVAGPGYAYADFGHSPAGFGPIAPFGPGSAGFGPIAPVDNATETFDPVGPAAYPRGDAPIPEQRSPYYDDQPGYFDEGGYPPPELDVRPAYEPGFAAAPGFERDAFQQFAPVDPTEERPGEGLIDLSAPRALPVTHRGRDGHRRRVLVALAAAAVVAAGGAGYALLHSLGQETNTAQLAPTASPSATPSLELGDTSTPQAVPAATSPSPSASGSTSTSASPSATVTTTPTRAATTSPGRTTAPAIVSPTTPANQPADSPLPPAATLAPTTAPLSAAFSFVTDNGSDPATGYAGTIRISNPNSAATSNWSVRLTVPGGGTVSVRGGSVVASRSGDTVTFTHAPGTGSITARNALTFTFDVSGELDTLPSGCSVNGVACS